VPCQWTNENKYRVNALFRKLIARCASSRPVRRGARLEVPVYVTTLVITTPSPASLAHDVAKEAGVWPRSTRSPRPMLDADLSAELKTEHGSPRRLRAGRSRAGHATGVLAIFDDLPRRKLESFQPDVIFNLADQFKNNRAFDQNIVSFLSCNGVPFTGCGLDRP
jgi:hypothetical protein